MVESMMFGVVKLYDTHNLTIFHVYIYVYSSQNEVIKSKHEIKPQQSCILSLQ